MPTDKNILSKLQQKELRNIIDTLVEERVQERQEIFVKKYTKFIVESATSKVVAKMKDGLILQVEERISDVQSKAKKACKSVLLEASSKVQKQKQIHKTILEEFKKTAPKLIEELAQKKATAITEESRGALEENDRLLSAFKGFTDGLAQAGYMINEDVDHIVEKERTEKRMLRTKLVSVLRENKIAQLTEGMLPGQKKSVLNLMEDCVTSKQVEDRFLTVKAKVLAEEHRHVETESLSEIKEKQLILEAKNSKQKNFSQLLSASKNFISG